MTFPKIELHVHLEGTVRPATLLEIAPDVTVEQVRDATEADLVIPERIPTMAL